MERILCVGAVDCREMDKSEAAGSIFKPSGRSYNGMQVYTAEGKWSDVREKVFNDHAGVKKEPARCINVIYPTPDESPKKWGAVITPDGAHWANGYIFPVLHDGKPAKLRIDSEGIELDIHLIEECGPWLIYTATVMHHPTKEQLIKHLLEIIAKQQGM